MRQTLLVVSVAIALAAGSAFHGRLSVAAPAPAPPVPLAQHLFYTATWNALPVARGELTIDDVTPADATPTDEPAVRLAGHAETMPLLDLLWRMRDSFEATVATTPLAPRRFVLRQHENSRRRETTVVRDPQSERLLGAKQRPGKRAAHAAADLHAHVHDPASVAYAIRSFPADADRAETYDVFTGTKTYRLTVRPAGVESVSALGRPWRARRFDLSLALAPVGERPTPGVTDRIQAAQVWVSDDAERLPLRLTGRTYWGWVTVQLVARRPPRTSAPG